MKRLIIVFLLLPLFAVAQSPQQLFMKIDVKPIDPKKGYTFEIYKNKDEIRIDYKVIDSIKKFSFAAEDKKVISRLLAKVDIDSLSSDSIEYYQAKLEAIKQSNTFYKQESISIYKTTHKAYFKFLQEVINMPDSVLTDPQVKIDQSENTYCFFTINEEQPKKKRTFYIESLEPKSYPILAKLISDTDAIVKAYKIAKEKKN